MLMVIESHTLAWVCASVVSAILLLGRCLAFTKDLFDFYRASSYASALFKVVILSICLSVWLSVCHRVFCVKTKQCTADILIPQERAVIIVFCTNSGWWATPFSSEICAQNDPPPSKHADVDRFPLITSRKCSVMTNRKSTTGFPTSYRWSAYITPKSSPMDGCWLKKLFLCFLNKMQL